MDYNYRNIKGGRPKKDEAQRRRHHIKAGFTDQEYDIICHKAQLSGLSIANYLHDATLRANVRQRISNELLDLIRDLAGMGNNLNQLLRAVNKNGLSQLEPQCRWMLGNISNLIRKISKGDDEPFKGY